MSSDQGSDQSEAISNQESKESAWERKRIGGIRGKMSAWELRAEKTGGRGRPSSSLIVKGIYV
jgi:hypothetical protein